jgi:hypothetical protein
MRRLLPRLIAAPLAALVVVPVAGCATATPSTPDLARAGCPADIRILTDSAPRVEQGALFRLLGEPRLVRAERRTVSAPLTVDGESTGVRLTIVFGEAFDGTTTTSRLYGDENLLLAAVDADLAIVDADQFPTVAVFAPLDRDPQVILWDPAIYPNIRTIAELGNAVAPDGEPVRVLGDPGDLALDTLVGAGLLREEQILPEYDGTLDAYTAAGGTVALQGEITVDPRRVPSAAVDTPVRYQSIHDAGYARYPGMLAARPADVTRYADCLSALIPILQQATVDFLAEPEPIAEAVADLASRIGGPSPYDLATALAAAELLRTRSLIGNGADDTVGNIEGGRMQELFDVAVPALRDRGYGILDGLEPSDIATDAFIDPAIGF